MPAPICKTREERLHRSVLPIVTALLGWLALCAPASATTIIVDQVWERNLLFGAGVDPDDVLITRARFDDSGVSASGTFDVPLSDFTVSHVLNGVGQSFSRIVFPVPRGGDGDAYARVIDGVFDSVGIIGPVGGIAQMTVRDLTSGVDVGIRLGFDAPSGRDELIRLFGGSGAHNYLLLTTTVSGAASSALPEPASLALLCIAFVLYQAGRATLTRELPGSRRCA